MNKLTSLLAGIGFGAGLMYFYDPSRGNRRRVLVRDQITSTMNKTDDAIDVAVQDLRNRTRGVLAETMSKLSNESNPDWLITERVRAELGRTTSHTGAIRVSTAGGNVTLNGPVLADEADRIVRRVSHVPGVKDVNNQMEVHEEPGNIPGLQGEPRLRQTDNWSPSLRLLSGVGGGLLALYGTLRKGLIGSTLQVAGLGLAARGVTNLNMKSLLGMTGRRDAINLEKAININAPVDQLYQFWENYENFPRFMSHLKQVKDLGNGRSHWVARGPAGKEVEWDAITTRQEPNKVIAWESVAGSEIKNQGTVRFRPNQEGGTRVSVHMTYTPPAGVVGHAAATLLGDNPKQAMDDDLASLKTLFETGKTHVEGQKLTGQDLAGATS